jgi:hypothetical protein
VKGDSRLRDKETPFSDEAEEERDEAERAKRLARCTPAYICGFHFPAEFSRMRHRDLPIRTIAFSSILFSCAAIGLIGTLVYAVAGPRVYEARAVLEIHPNYLKDVRACWKPVQRDFGANLYVSRIAGPVWTWKNPLKWY